EIGEIRQIRPQVLWAAIGLATTGLAIIQAFTYTLVANTMFIMGTVPFITMIAAYLFLSERVTRTTAIAMGLSMAGLVIMIADGIGTGSGYGNLMALVAAMGFSLFAVMARACRGQDMLPALFLAPLIVVLVSLVGTLDDLTISWRDFLLCVLWGAGISGLAHWVFVLAARYIAAAQLTLFGLFETALAPFWVWLFIGETPGWLVLIGGGAIIISIGLKSVMELQAHA
ncbi:MAG: DMT family transporter, partial [Pseudomonadota bacterium]